jgi:multisubunit Na+/H+ antiporter MnhE subunit
MSAQSKSLPARLARAAGIALATWISLAAVWMLLVDNESLPELLVGAGVVCIATAGSELVRAQRIAEVRFRAPWLLRLWKPLARIPLDVGIVMWELVRQLVQRRPERGSLRALRFRASAETAGDNGRRALAELAGSMAPNTIVVGVDTRRNLILAHQLKPTADAESSLDPLDLR